MLLARELTEQVIGLAIDVHRVSGRMTQRSCTASA